MGASEMEQQKFDTINNSTSSVLCYVVLDAVALKILLVKRDMS